jgi:hypothetical protein
VSAFVYRPSSKGKSCKVARQSLNPRMVWPTAPWALPMTSLLTLRPQCASASGLRGRGAVGTHGREEESATALAVERRGAHRGGVHSWLRGAVLLTDTSQNSSTGFGHRVRLADAHRRRNGSHRRNQDPRQPEHPTSRSNRRPWADSRRSGGCRTTTPVAMRYLRLRIGAPNARLTRQGPASAKVLATPALPSRRRRRSVPAPPCRRASPEVALRAPSSRRGHSSPTSRPP